MPNDKNKPLQLQIAVSNTSWVRSAATVLYFRTTPDPSARRGYLAHVMAIGLDGKGRRELTPHDAIWSQVSPDGTLLASISFERHLHLTDMASAKGRILVDDVMPQRAATLRTELPPTLQWSPDQKRLLVQTPEVDRDGDGLPDVATMRSYDVADGKVEVAFTLPQMGPFLWRRDGRAILLPADDERVRVLELPSLRETRAPFSPDEAHVNQTPSLVLHQGSIARSDGALLEARGSSLYLVGRGAERVVVTGPTPIYSPSWSADGRHAVFYSHASLYVYDSVDHQLGVLGVGEPSPVLLHAGYRPAPARLVPPCDPFDLAYRTY